MKNIFSILICLLLTLSVKAQFSYDEDGQIIPFAMGEKYKNLIDTSKVSTCHLKSYNNDSLYKEKNKNINSQLEAVGFPIDTLIDLKALATKYKIENGTIWLYKIESKTAEMLSIKIDHLDLPEGAYLSLFPKQNKLKIHGPKTFTKENLKYPTFIDKVHGNQLFIEYFEPNNAVKNASIKISSIGYIYASPLKKKDKVELNENDTDVHLKSGSFGTSINACQKNVVCSEVSARGKQSRSPNDNGVYTPNIDYCFLTK
jgi:hypothetical protein